MGKGSGAQERGQSRAKQDRWGQASSLAYFPRVCDRIHECKTDEATVAPQSGRHSGRNGVSTAARVKREEQAVERIPGAALSCRLPPGILRGWPHAR